MLKRVIILLLFFTLIYEILLLLQLENKRKKKKNVFCVSVWLCDKLLTCPGWTSPVPDDSWEKWTPATLMTRSAGEAAVENETRRSYTIEIVK